MATAKEKIEEQKPFVDEWKIMRDVYVPQVRGEEKTLPVSVNDRNFAVPKGKRVQVPLPIYYVIQNMLELQQFAQDRAEQDLKTIDRGVIR